MYSELEMCWFFIDCKNATELITCREILESLGQNIGSVASDVYDVLMRNLLISDKI